MKLYLNVIIIITIWVISTLTIFYLSFQTLPKTALFPHDFVKNLANWDGGHYLGIAQNGYLQKSQYVFFPLYPLLINLLTKITGSYLYSGLLISFISFLLSANLLFQLVREDFGKAYGIRVLLALLFFPLSFYFLTVYTESLFLLLSLLTFLFLRKKKYFWATIFASLASTSRVSGLAVVLSLILSVYFTEGFNKKNWLVLFSPLGFLLYCLYLYQRIGDPFYFIQAESNFWHTGLVLPGSALVFSFKKILMNGFLDNFRGVLDFLFVVFALVMIVKVFKKLSLDYTIFSITSLLLPLFSPTIVAIPRYLLTIFPIFIVFSFYKNQYVILAYQIIGLMLFSIYAVLFINGFWVA